MGEAANMMSLKRREHVPSIEHPLALSPARHKCQEHILSKVTNNKEAGARWERKHIRRTKHAHAYVPQSLIHEANVFTCQDCNLLQSKVVEETRTLSATLHNDRSIKSTPNVIRIRDVILGKEQRYPLGHGINGDPWITV